MFLLNFFGSVNAVPVNVMLPLTLLDNSGNVKDEAFINSSFDSFKNAGVHGVMMDVWWGIVETAPQTYNFAGYLRVLELAKQRGLKVQPITSLHRCGGNVNDDCNIPLPSWVLNVATQKGLFFQDLWGWQNQEVLSVSADYANVFPTSTGGLRTGLDLHKDFMRAMQKAFSSYLTDKTIDNVQIGLGPAGELRYPSYPSAKWKYPGVGAFQCFDAEMIKRFQSAAKAAGHPDWNSPPTDAGNYNSTPSSTSFFTNGFSTEYGRFFLSWYQNELLQHGKDILNIATSIFGQTSIAAKVSGIHWHYGSPSHAAELTAGYYNANGNNAYDDIAEMFDVVHFDFTCLEMTDSSQASCNCNSKPEELVRQVIDSVKNFGGVVSGENALNTYSQSGYTQILNQLKYGKSYFGAFTYLRLSSTLMQSNNWNLFKQFVSDAAKI